ncbi:MAG: NAD-dependent epimerase/dehydratase family protein [Acidobacteriota bacterium]
MRVFVTGGTGFIGSRTVRRLSAEGHQLRCLVRPRSDRRTLDEVKAEPAPGDVTDPHSLAAGVAGCDAVVNIAAAYDFWVPDRGVYERVNVQGMRNLMEAAIAARVRKVVHVSTAAVWGEAPWPITERSELGAACATAYARSKRVGDQVARDLADASGVPLVTIHPGAVTGEGDPKASGKYLDMLRRGRLPAQIMPSRSFSFVYVGDVAEAICRALDKPDNDGEKYIVVAENRTWGEVNRMACEIAGSRLPLLTLPDWLTELNARLLTALADLVKRPPLMNLALDQVLLMKQGLSCDGNKAARELGLAYTPLRTTLERALRRDS